MKLPRVFLKLRGKDPIELKPVLNTRIDFTPDPLFKGPATGNRTLLQHGKYRGIREFPSRTKAKQFCRAHGIRRPVFHTENWLPQEKRA